MEDKTKRLIIKLIHRFPKKESALLPALSMIQKRNGHITEHDLEEIAKIMDLPEARVFSAASFYTMLSLKRIGKYHIQVCTNVVCSLLKGESLLKHLSEKLGVQEGEITQDGLFSIASVECLGSCGNAPAIQINMDHYEDMSIEKVDAMIEDIKKMEWQD
ncbi:MAG: NAD(P)H-dependent oxidoreductase subunit E [Nitrospirae bacterium]|nr:NAD(P)H-dependent oxidoreductase subunit E [Nitrospirota bacterium]